MKKIKSILLNLMRILFEYLSLIATIIGSIYIIVSSQIIDYSQDKLLLWIIGLLGLIATAQGAEKYFKLNKIESEIKDLKSLSGQAKEDSFTRIELSPLEDRLSDAKTITITGGSLKRISDEYYAFLERNIKKGCKLEVIMVKPNSPAADMLCDNIVYETHDHADYSETIQKSLNRFLELKRLYDKKVTIRLSENVPPFSIMVKNEKLGDAELKIELYSFVVPTRERKQFQYRSIDNKKEFDFYMDQLKTLRDNSSEVIM